MTFTQRIDALKPYTETGPQHVRGVAELISDAERFHAWKNEAMTEIALQQAEARVRDVEFPATISL